MHACWHQPTIDKLDKIINEDKTLPEEMYYTASIEGHDHYKYIENVVKALEEKLPSDKKFDDKDGNPRDAIRIKWWSTEEPTYKNLALTVPKKSMADIPDEIIKNVYLYSGDKPVFFGHYWMEGKPTIQSNKVACTDYRAGKEGDLIAYRWNGENDLNSNHFFPTAVFKTLSDLFIIKPKSWGFRGDPYLLEELPDKLNGRLCHLLVPN